MTVYAIGVTVLLFGALAWGCWATSRMHSAKADVYQEFADTFTAMRWNPDKTKRREWMRLCLCDPNVCDGLRAALADADEHWRGLNRLQDRLEHHGAGVADR